MSKMKWNRPHGGYDTTGRFAPERGKKLYVSRGFWNPSNAPAITHDNSSAFPSKSGKKPYCVNTFTLDFSALDT